MQLLRFFNREEDSSTEENNKRKCVTAGGGGGRVEIENGITSRSFQATRTRIDRNGQERFFPFLRTPKTAW